MRGGNSSDLDTGVCKAGFIGPFRQGVGHAWMRMACTELER